MTDTGATGGDRAPVALVVRTLLRSGLLTPEDAVGPGIVAVDRSVSHQAVRVDVGGEPRLFVKLADPVGSQGRDLTAEAAVYRAARASAALAAVVPRCHAIGVGDSPIVLEAVAGVPLSQTHLAYGGSTSAAASRRDDRILEQYGRAVATTHATTVLPGRGPPWLLGALEPRWEHDGWLPEPCRRLLRRLAAQPALRRGFRAAASAWRAECLVHGDLRWANVLVGTGGATPPVWLIDWELAGEGDPAWDVGSVIADLLGGAALAEAPGGGGGPPDASRAAQAFARGYRDRSGASDDEWAALAARSVGMAGVRLVQSLVEYGSVSAAHLAAAEPVLVPLAVQCLTDRPALPGRASRWWT